MLKNDAISHEWPKLFGAQVLYELQQCAVPLAVFIFLSSMLALLYLATLHFVNSRSVFQQDKNEPHLPRQPGTWKPSPFTRPNVSPYPDWSVKGTRPLPYRPFRPGPYKTTMGIRPMPWDSWIELDNEYLHFHNLKSQRIADRGAKCCRTAPEAWPAAIELLEELSSYLPERYPSLFIKTSVGINNLVTNESFDVRSNKLTVNGVKEDPMQLAARLVQDELAIMIERHDGKVYLLAGAILLAGFWRLEDKFGMCLDDIHLSGDVPDYSSKLSKGMNNFFRRIQPEKPVVRNNYFIQVDGDLAWSHSIGSEDGEGIGWATAEKDKGIEDICFRSERQSLRRLPRSGGIVFTIRTYFLPVTHLVEEPGVAGRLASAIRGWGENVAWYKGKERYGDVLLKFLDQRHVEEVQQGLAREDFGDGGERRYPW